eukprot:GFKZ01002294.1.p2 GENE.GFKZ01002294.1~~GFKZ01002294.1.p2  ORF type:complete len:161 (+),score=38.53 GFKZ01002294.1:262-744(+)
MPAAKKSSTTTAKPTYAVMVAESIKELKDRTGSSVPAISKQVQSKYGIDINKPALVKAIKKGVEAGDLIQIKASYKLNKKTPAPPAKAKKPAEKKKPAPKPAARKTATAKKAVTKKPKKTIAKKTSTSKRSTTTTTKKAATTKKPAPRKATSSKRKASKK